MKFAVIVLISTVFIISCSKQSKHKVTLNITYPPMTSGATYPQIVLGKALPNEMLKYCSSVEEKNDERLQCGLSLNDSTKFNFEAINSIVTNVSFDIIPFDGNFKGAADNLLNDLGMSLEDVGFKSFGNVGVNLVGERLDVNIHKVGPCPLNEVFACSMGMPVGEFSSCPADHELRCGEDSPKFVKISGHQVDSSSMKYIQASDFKFETSTPVKFGLAELGQELGLSDKLKMECEENPFYVHGRLEECRYYDEKVGSIITLGLHNSVVYHLRSQSYGKISSVDSVVSNWTNEFGGQSQFSSLEELPYWAIVGKHDVVQKEYSNGIVVEIKANKTDASLSIYLPDTPEYDSYKNSW